MSAPSLAVPAQAPAPLSIAEIHKPVRRELEQVQERLRESFRTPIPILNQVGGYVLATRGKVNVSRTPSASTSPARSST